MSTILLTIGLIIVGIIFLIASQKGWIDDQRIANTVTVLTFIAALAVLFTPLSSSPEIVSTTQPNIPPIETSTLPKPTMESSAPLAVSSASPISASLESNWARPFEYRFPSGFWVVGEHKYTIDLICSTLTDENDNILRGNWNVTFQVSENADLYSTPLYLRLSGIRTKILDGESVEALNPSQETIGVLILADSTLEEAELSANDCNATIQWDNAVPQVLVPKEIFQQ